MQYSLVLLALAGVARAGVAQRGESTWSSWGGYSTCPTVTEYSTEYSTIYSTVYSTQVVPTTVYETETTATPTTIYVTSTQQTEWTVWETPSVSTATVYETAYVTAVSTQ